MEWLLQIWNTIFPDVLFYGLTAIVLLIGLMRCCKPVFSIAAELCRAERIVRESARDKIPGAVWMTPGFLGKKLNEEWNAFLQAAQLSKARNLPCDIADYINEDTVIDAHAGIALAEFLPGACTSLGILGTFVGLSIGLKGLDVMEITSLTQLTNGIALAFNTSIVGIVASLIFSFVYRFANRKAQKALDTFITTFYHDAIPQPPDQQVQLLAFQTQQSESFRTVADVMSTAVAQRITDAVREAFNPIRDTVQDFIACSTTAQVNGVERISEMVLQRLSNQLGGKVQELRGVLSETVEVQKKALQSAEFNARALQELSRNVTDSANAANAAMKECEQLIRDFGRAMDSVSQTSAKSEQLLQRMTDTSARQTQYLAALQDYQEKLQKDFHDYTVWTDQFVSGLEERTQVTNSELERIANEMRASGSLLQSSYKSFVESIEVGLANALGLFDENMQHLVSQVNGTLEQIDDTMKNAERTFGRHSVQ